MTKIEGYRKTHFQSARATTSNFYIHMHAYEYILKSWLKARIECSLIKCAPKSSARYLWKSQINQ